jgi:hypothetical protein
MTTLDSELRPAQRAREERRDPREVFREFLDNLARTASRQPEKPPKANGVRRPGQ